MSRATVLRAVVKGLLRPALVTPGGHRRFRIEDVERLGSRLTADGRDAQLIGSSEAARLLGVSQPTLNRAVRNGQVHAAAITPGGHRRFDTSEIYDSLREAANGAGRGQGQRVIL